MMTAPDTGHPRHITVNIIQHSITVWKERKDRKKGKEGEQKSSDSDREGADKGRETEFQDTHKKGG